MNYTALLLLITLGIGLIVIMSAVFKDRVKKERMKLTKVGVFFLVIGAVVGILGFGGFVPQLQQEISFEALAVADDGVIDGLDDDELCAVEDTTVTLSAIDSYTATAVGGNHRYRINGAPALEVSDAGTFTASPGDNIQILWVNESSTVDYFSSIETVVVPCSGTKIFSTELYQNGTLTMEVFNEEGNLIATPENETLGSGDVVTLVAKLKGTYQRGFPYGGIIVAEYGAEIYDDVIVDFGGSKTSAPIFYPRTTTNNVSIAYTVPAILSNQILEGTILLDVGDENPASTQDVLLTFYPNNYFVNEDTSGSFDGPAISDEDDAQTYGHMTNLSLQVD